MAKKDINWLVVIGILALVLLIGKFKFAGILATFCENTEPASISEYQSTIASLNGTIKSVTPTITIQQDGSNVAFLQYSIKAPFGDLEAFPTDPYPCNSVLAIVDKQLDNTSFVVINERQALLAPMGILFCNYANNVLLLTPSTSGLSIYLETFSVCESKETNNVTSPYVEVQSECERLNGIWINSTCLCENGDRLQLNRACPETVRSGQSSTSGSSLSSTPVNATTVVNADPQYPSTQTIYILAGIAIVLFIIYWVFERGPDKGLIKER